MSIVGWGRGDKDGYKDTNSGTNGMTRVEGRGALGEGIQGLLKIGEINVIAAGL